MRPPLDPRDHVAWLAYWGDETLKAIATAVGRAPRMLTPDWDYDLEAVARCARAAAGRARRLSARQVARLLKGGD